jgi:hypothetical protein
MRTLKFIDGMFDVALMVLSGWMVFKSFVIVEGSEFNQGLKAMIYMTVGLSILLYLTLARIARALEND